MAEEIPATVGIIANFWSEWTDDDAPLRERTLYARAASVFLERFNVTHKEIDD